jgi:hypothetical protein
MPMTLKRFPYLLYAGDGPSPSLEVTLVGVNGFRHTTLALVDTGSEWSGISSELARLLGAPALVAIEGQGGGGVFAQEWWQDGPTVEVMGYEIQLSPTVNERMPIVALGRNDLLRHFRLVIEQAEHAFTLEPTGELIAAG